MHPMTQRLTAAHKKAARRERAAEEVKTVTIKLDRREVCKVLSALTAAGQVSDNAEFFEIHEKVKAQLDDWDEKRKASYPYHKSE